MEKVKVGIVGLGRSGWNIHGELLGSLPDKYQVVATCDTDKSRREESERKFSCRSYSDLNSLLQDKGVELVIIATPSYLHASNAIEALKAGKNVVCEKPMATKFSDADRIIKAAKKVGKILTVFHNARYSPDFLKVKQIINSGKLGRIIMIKMCGSLFGRRWDWQTLKKFGGGTLNNTAPHAIDQALQLFGEKEPEIFCHLERTVTLGDADDHLKIIFRAKGMPMIDLEISNACAYPTDYWNVMGTRGGLRGSASELCWKYFDPANLTKREVETQPTPDRSYNKEKIPWQEESWNASSGEFPGQMGFYLDLYRTLNDKSPLTITAESARRVMWVIEKCHRMSGI